MSPEDSPAELLVGSGGILGSAEFHVPDKTQPSVPNLKGASLLCCAREGRLCPAWAVLSAQAWQFEQEEVWKHPWEVSAGS